MAESQRTIFIHQSPDGLDIAAVGDGCVRIEHLAANSGESFSALLARSADALAPLGLKAGQEVCLGLASSQVFSAPVARGDLPRRARQTAMLYRLEEVLPLDAESLTADFATVSAEQAMGVAVRTQDVKKTLDELTAAGLEASATCPTALLAAWQICRLREGSDGDAARKVDWVVLGLDGRVEIIRLHQDKFRAWYTCCDNYDEMACWLGTDVMALPPQEGSALMVTSGSLDPQTPDRLAEKFNLTLERCETSPLDLAATASAAALAGQGGGWVNLRRDSLAMPKPWARFKNLIQAAAMLAVLLPLVLAGSFYYRSVRYHDESSRLRSDMADQFRQANPGSKVPPQVKSVLEAQYKKLAAVTGCGLDSGVMPNSLNTLRAAAAALPPQVRTQISEILVDPAGLYATGEVLQHSDVEIIARALRKAGFTVDSTPSNRQSEHGVAFRLKARPPERQEQITAERMSPTK